MRPRSGVAKWQLSTMHWWASALPGDVLERAGGTGLEDRAVSGDRAPPHVVDTSPEAIGLTRPS
jgi:hypothetical protein